MIKKIIRNEDSPNKYSLKNNLRVSSNCINFYFIFIFIILIKNFINLYLLLLIIFFQDQKFNMITIM